MARLKSNKTSATDHDIGRRIRARRRALGMKRSRLAAAIGVTSARVRKYENGDCGIPASALLRVGAALGAAPAQFLQGDEETPACLAPPSAIVDLDAEELLWVFAAIKSKERRRAIVDFVSFMGDSDLAARQERRARSQ